MVVHYSETRKIDPTKGNVLGDNTPNDKNRIEIGPTQLALEEWDVAGLRLPDLRQMRRFRLARLTRHIVDRGYGGLLMSDPLNIRYATTAPICSFGIQITYFARFSCRQMAIWSSGITKIRPFYPLSTPWCANSAPGRTSSISVKAIKFMWLRMLFLTKCAF